MKLTTDALVDIEAALIPKINKIEALVISPQLYDAIRETICTEGDGTKMTYNGVPVITDNSLNGWHMTVRYAQFKLTDLHFKMS